MRSRNLRWLAGFAAAALLTLSIPSVATANPSPAPSPARSNTNNDGRLSDPDRALGAGWRSSSDALVTGVGDTDGFHIMVAREKDAYAWKTLATLRSASLDMGEWTGYTCVTGSGHYAVAVYAPSMAANKPNLLEAGALAAVVNLSTGQSRLVATGVQLAYFNPACGSGDQALLTRAIGADEQQTDLLTVDAAAGKVTATHRIDAQFTTPLPAPDGDYGIVNGALVKVASSGKLTTIAHPAGRVFGLANSGSAIDMVSVSGSQAIAERYAGGATTRLGTGAWDRLQLFGEPGGRDVLVGDVGKIRTGGVTGLTTLTSDRQVQAVSTNGHLLAVDVLTAQAAKSVTSVLSPVRASDAGRMTITERATHSGREVRNVVHTTAAPTLDAARPGAVSTPQKVAGTQQTATPAGDVGDGLNVSDPTCAVPRNDLRRQVLQPSPNMVEWAVDQAVHGDLTLTRPANYLADGEPAYSPQGLFKLQSLDGGGTVPAQVMLGIVAQESNMDQATWHAVPGDAGNPLVADYYGSGDVSIDYINYAATDCGYGIAQVTDGMTATSGGPTLAQVAIATDYTTNIARGLQILISKWNQLADLGMTVNGNQSQYIEDWYDALWAYNSGVHTDDGQGNKGLGWLNNPANPTYPANRKPFLRGGGPAYDDANHPGDWPYQERVMGWAETPQLKGDPSEDGYAPPSYPKEGITHLDLPIDESSTGYYLFCEPDVNSCTQASPCPADDDSCWWDKPVSWTSDCSTKCGQERLGYSLGSSEPDLDRIYPTHCEPLTEDGAIVVDDLADSSLNALGCFGQPSGGKFTIRVGYGPGQSTQAYYGQIDLHQGGAGYLGHMWFTHTYDPSTKSDYYPNYTERDLHYVAGTWSPDLPDPGPSLYDVMAYMPDHGADDKYAQYWIYTGSGETYQTCTVDQSKAETEGGGWMYLGLYSLTTGAHVKLSNMQSGDDGTTDIAYDAMAFVPSALASNAVCNEPVN